MLCAFTHWLVFKLEEKLKEVSEVEEVLEEVKSNDFKYFRVEDGHVGRKNDANQEHVRHI